MTPEHPLCGLLPAAGRGLRFGASGYAKELFPLLWQSGEVLAPRPICDLALRAIRRAGATRCAVIVSPHKPEVLQVLGAGGEVDLALAYLVQDEPAGLPHAVRCAVPWLGESDVLLALPDTVVLPEDALFQVYARQRASGADVVLGVFPVEEPERLGPVEFDADGRVLRVLDKPDKSPVRNSWALASWSPRFTSFCAAWDAAAEARGRRERVLGHAFQAAHEAGLRVEAVFFPAGLFLDIGTPHGLSAALRVLAAEGMLLAEQALLVPGAEAGSGGKGRP